MFVYVCLCGVRRLGSLLNDINGQSSDYQDEDRGGTLVRQQSGVKSYVYYEFFGSHGYDPRADKFGV